MPVTKFGPGDLLEYNPRYEVLICRECQYAIQKSAMESHLLRHKIYREERQTLLSSIAKLDLFEPDEVPLPTPDSPPIDGLPILHGYRCSVHGCGTLFASERRMKHHQREMHAGIAGCEAYAVKLQTFFRGTKIRYFEVTDVNSTRTTPPGAESQVITENSDDVKMSGEDEQTPPKSSPINIDLETLTYFLHFTTTTSLTLPCTENPQSGAYYWQTEVIHQALQQRWIMCGLLALSASHLAACADDRTIERVHLERSAQLFEEFSAGWKEAPSNIGEEGKKTGEEIDRILCCIHWKQNPSQLHSIMTILRRFVNPNSTSPYNNFRSDDRDHYHQMEAFSQASRIASSSNHSADGPLPALLNHLNSLPSRMTEVFGKPEHLQGVLANISAIAVLVECCGISYSNDKEVAFEGMTRWLGKVSDHFYHMVSIRDSAALVVLAHWAGLLVERAEFCGSWFLKDLAKTILLQISESLPADEPAIFRLIEDLIR